MAVTKLKHWLKYYKEIQSQGHTWRLEILQWASRKLVQVEIGSVLQGLRLYVQGDQSDIDTPIVKTSLEMTFVDAPDLEADRKCGNWDVFYTSSATEYKVKLYKDGVVEWTGYITPDSYSEDLMYRGSVTIVARDNLGALQEFEFDAAGDEDGMITLYDLVHTGMERVSFAMDVYDDHSAASVFPLCVDADSPILYNVKFNVSSFREKSWQEAIEDAMYSCGVVLRYIGKNQFFFCPLRAVPLMGKDMWYQVATKDVQFVSYGHRELSPAVKTIVEEVNFELKDNISEIVMPEEAYGEESIFTFCLLSEHSGSVSNPLDEIPVHATIGGNFERRSAETSLAFNPFLYPLKAGYSSPQQGSIQDSNKVYIAANGGINIADDARMVEYRQLVGVGDYGIDFSFGYPIALYDELTKVGFIDVDVEFSSLKFRLYYESRDGSEVKRYDYSSNVWVDGLTDEWESVYPNAGFPYTLSAPVLNTSTIGHIVLQIKRVSATQLKVEKPISRGMYIPLQDISITEKFLENTGIANSQKIRTNYNSSSNILIKRLAEYGFNPTKVASPMTVRNGMYVMAADWYVGSQQWVFHEGDTPNPLLVLIHQQLLAYYSKPNNILTGELAVDDADFSSLYLWKGKKHLLTAGALNILTGHIEGATLREFKRYSELWETDAETDYVEFRIGGGTQTIALTSNKELTSADVHIDDTWCSATIESTGSQAYSLTINAGYNTTGEARVAFITIDTFTIMVRQIAHLIID